MEKIISGLVEVSIMALAKWGFQNIQEERNDKVPVFCHLKTLSLGSEWVKQVLSRDVDKYRSFQCQLISLFCWFKVLELSPTRLGSLG